MRAHARRLRVAGDDKRIFDSVNVSFSRNGASGMSETYQQIGFDFGTSAARRN